MSKIEYFKIRKLFNQYDVELFLEEDVNIFIDENGMGKTTILNCLYGVLSGRLEKLDNIVFEKIQIKFENNKELILERKDLIRYLEENVYDTPRYRRMRHTNLGNIFSEKEKEELRDIAREANFSFEEIKNYAIRVSEVYGMPLRMARDEIERYIFALSRPDEYGDEKKAIVFKKKIEELVEEEVLYFPTYRRIEEDLSKLGLDVDKDSLKNKLIQFGMSDVENRINMILETIRKAAMTGFTKMTGVLLKQYLDNKVVNDGKQSIDEEKLNIALERIGEEIETSDKIKIRKLVSDGTIYKDSNEHLLNLIVNLIESYEKQSFYDEKVKKFKDVCNGYLDGKKYVYDESNLTLEIYRDNYRKPINLKNLSSGEKQVLSIFSKLYLDDEKPCIILFDEPELSLSIKWQEHFLPDIMESQKCKMLIAVTHSPFIFENQYDNLAQDMGRCITEVKGE